MIFKIFQIRKDIKEGREAPASFAVDKGFEFFFGLLLIPLIIYLAVVTLLFLSGYTEVFGFESGLARLVFWLLAIPGAIFSLMFYKIRKFIKKLSKRGDTKIKEKIGDSHIIDSEVVEEIYEEK
jgi:uncharacterized membrane protein